MHQGFILFEISRKDFGSYAFTFIIHCRLTHSMKQLLQSNRSASLLLDQDLDQFAHSVFRRAKEYTQLFENIICLEANRLWLELSGNSVNEEICICSFGGPARREVLGESDADIPRSTLTSH